MAGECDTVTCGMGWWQLCLKAQSHSSCKRVMVADVCWSSQCGQGAGSQPLFWISQWDIVQQAALHCLTGHQCLEVTQCAQSVPTKAPTAQTECPYCLSFPEAEVILSWNDLKAEICSVLSDTPLWGESWGCFFSLLFQLKLWRLSRMEQRLGSISTQCVPGQHCPRWPEKL